MIEHVWWDDDDDAPEYVVSCTGCGKERLFYDRDWKYMIESLKSDGWKITKMLGRWVHMCPECMAEHRKNSNDIVTLMERSTDAAWDKMMEELHG